MKRYMCAALAAALLAPGLWAVSARAEDDGAPPPRSEKSEKGEHQRGGGAMTAKMKEKLGLNDAQAAKFQEAMKSHGEAMKTSGEQMKDALKKLGEQVKAKAKDEEIQGTLDALKTARQAMAADHEKFEASLAEFLTPTQRAKMAIGMAMMMRNGPGGMRGRMGGRGGHGGRGGDRDGDDDGGKGDGDHGHGGHGDHGGKQNDDDAGE